MKESHQRQKPLIFLAPSHKLSKEFSSLFDALNNVDNNTENSTPTASDKHNLLESLFEV